MRSAAAVALLISSGLSAPVEKGSTIRRFDSLFVRGASADVPTENKSAFGAEMGGEYRMIDSFACLYTYSYCPQKLMM
jgi:hypothetical protein